MENDYFNKKCVNHKNEYFNFYCFDDKTFLCDICFKEHRKHNIEVKSELIKFDKLYKFFNEDKPIKKMLEEIKSFLNNIKEKLEKQILPTVNSLLESFTNLTPDSKNNNTIFNLNFQEYENIEEFVKLTDSIKEISEEFKKIIIKNSMNYEKFRIIDKEVNIIEHSKIYDQKFNLDVMLNKKNGQYSLFDGKTNHFAIFDFQKKIYLKNVLISVKQDCNCVLKNFKISFKNDKGNWELINSYICENEKYEKDMQNFPVNIVTQFIKIDFIDAWQYGHGNFILIKRISFEIADI